MSESTTEQSSREQEREVTATLRMLDVTADRLRARIDRALELNAPSVVMGASFAAQIEHALTTAHDWINRTGHFASTLPPTPITAEEAGREGEWLPIETAPKDGTAVLVMRNDWPGCKNGVAEECNGHNTYVAQWWAEERDGRGAWICYMDSVLDPECPVTPTHWMPLPAAPGIAPHQPQPEEPRSGSNVSPYFGSKQALVDWVAERWHAEVANRPLVNKNRRALDDCWRQMLRHLGVDDRARLGPTHDELLEGFE